jgi:aminoglycoside N3'-acetyltransferase
MTIDRIRREAARRVEPLNKLPRLFQTVIPNATRIAEATEVDRATPPTFRHKYSPEFAKLYEALCEEIVQRAEWQRSNQPAAGPEVVEV